MYHFVEPAFAGLDLKYNWIQLGTQRQQTLAEKSLTIRPLILKSQKGEKQWEHKKLVNSSDYNADSGTGPGRANQTINTDWVKVHEWHIQVSIKQYEKHDT